MVRLQTTIRGIPLVADEPDARYRRFHQFVYPAPEVDVVGSAVRVDVPERRDPTGYLLCSASSEWQIDGRRADPILYRHMRRHVTGEDLGGQWALLGPGTPTSTGVRRETSEQFRQHLPPTSGEWITVPIHLPPDDPELLALRAELDRLDAVWTATQTAECAAEDVRSDALARAALHDEGGRDPLSPPSELECLECGAVYDRPGSVEPGGMSCRRCGS